MRERPEVLAVDRAPDTVILQLRIPADLEFFPDHFPRLGIVPGVIQLAWAIAYGAEYLGTGGAFRRVAGLKFQRPILPRAQLRLELTRTGTDELTFAYRDDRQSFSGGRVVYAPA